MSHSQYPWSAGSGDRRHTLASIHGSVVPSDSLAWLLLLKPRDTQRQESAPLLTEYDVQRPTVAKQTGEP